MSRRASPHLVAAYQPVAPNTVQLACLAAYVLFGLGLFTAFLPTLIGVVICHAKRKDAAGSLEEAHFAWLIRTFWVSFGLGLACIALTVLSFGLLWPVAALLSALVYVWTIYRVVFGLIRLFEKRPIG